MKNMLNYNLEMGPFVTVENFECSELSFIS